jgi:DNA recombination protein RmuC
MTTFLCILSIALLAGIGTSTALLLKNQKARAEAQTNQKLAEQNLIHLQSIVDELKNQNETLKTEQDQLVSEKLTLSNEAAKLQTAIFEKEKAAAEKIEELHKAHKQMEQSFEALSSKILKSNSESFLQQAKEAIKAQQENAKGDLEKRQQAIQELVNPIKEKLGEVDKRLLDFDRVRQKSETSLDERIKALAESELRLQKETGKLVQALHKSDVRGQWGEMQLRKAVEYAGMIEHCDFNEQVSVSTEDKGPLRPDMIIHLPNQREIIVDAKAPMEAYLKAMGAENPDERQRLLADHARQVKDKIKQLATKSYWKQFNESPEFVVLFLPNEALFSSALEYDSSLINYGASERVILSTPTTLIALLLAVAYGWQQEQLTRNAKTIRELGAELFDRAKTFGDYMNKLGRSLGSAVDAYNKAASSAQSRLLVSARKMKELTTGETPDLPEPQPIEKTTRSLELE